MNGRRVREEQNSWHSKDGCENWFILAAHLFPFNFYLLLLKRFNFCWERIKLYLCRFKVNGSSLPSVIICLICNLWLAVTKIWIHISNTNNKVQSTCKYYTNKDIQIWKLKKLQVNNGRVSSLASSSVTTYGLQSHTATQGIAVKIRMRYGHSKSYHLVTV